MVVIIQAMALVVITVGTVEAFARSFRAILRPLAAEQIFRQVWVRYARWLVGGLTFQLAADIVQTAITPDWQDIGQLAAIAAIRTLLNYFLERDLAEAGGDR